MNLREIADRMIGPQLATVPGVAEVLHMGGDVPQFHVVVDAQKLVDFRITLRDVLFAVEEANVYAAGGFLTEGPLEYQVEGLGRAYSLEDFDKAVVLPYGGVLASDPTAGEVAVTLESLGETTLGAEIRRGAASRDGEEAVLGKVAKSPGVSTFAVTEALLEAFDGLNVRGIRLEPVYLQGDLIRRAVDNVLEALYIGAFLVVVVLALFLLKVRPTLICLTSIPLSILLTVVVLHWLDLTINVMTLGGLAIAVGMVVDDSIIDVENTHRRLVQFFRSPGAGDTSERVNLRATLEIRTSILFATLIIVLVFLPLLGMGGFEGRMFGPLGIAVIVAMGCSLVVSWIVTPALCQLLLGRGGRGMERESPTVGLARRAYRPVVGFAISHRLPVVIAALAVIAAALAVAGGLGTELLPAMDEGALVVNALLSPGTSLEESFAIGQRIEGRLLEVPEVTSVATRTGRAEEDEHAEGVHYNEILVNLVPAEERERDLEEVKAAVRAKLEEFPGVAMSIGQPISHRLDHLLSGVEAQVAVKIFGPRLSVLRDKAEEVRAVMAGVEGTGDLFVEPQVEVPTLRVDIDREALAIYGLTAEEVVEFVNAAFNGEEAGQVLRGPVAYDVLVRLGGWEGRSVEEALELRMQTQLGESVPLKEVALIRRRQGPSVILREDLSRRIVVQCNAVGRDLGSVVREVRERVAEQVELPEGYFLVYGGQAESGEEAMRSLALQLVFVVAGIFVLLFFGLGSIRLALVVMLNIPLALVGGVAAVWATGGVASVSSAVGFILLFGIAVRNGIILVGHINDLRAQEGLELFEAVRRGAQERIGPVLMTALSTGLGMLPLALSRGSGAEIQRPLAIVMIGGMITATLLTLVVLPALYALVERAAEVLRDRGGAGEG
jgi:CzcA family heavy metal efflux pump